MRRQGVCARNSCQLKQRCHRQRTPCARVAALSVARSSRRVCARLRLLPSPWCLGAAHLRRPCARAEGCQHVPNELEPGGSRHAQRATARSADARGSTGCLTEPRARRRHRGPRRAPRLANDAAPPRVCSAGGRFRLETARRSKRAGPDCIHPGSAGRSLSARAPTSSDVSHPQRTCSRPYTRVRVAAEEPAAPMSQRTRARSPCRRMQMTMLGRTCSPGSPIPQGKAALGSRKIRRCGSHCCRRCLPQP